MIVFNHVSKSYSVGKPTLVDVSFSIEPGDFVVISGKSGAGKTTLAKLLIKEIEPTEGEIIFQDQPLTKLRKSQLHTHRRNIGVVYQDYKLLSDLTVRENIALALYIVGKEKAEIESRISDLLTLVQLEDKIDYFPRQLSGGEIQRVSIARALANAPVVLFADEPTGNLDKETGKYIVQILKKINSLGTTVLMSTHEEFDFSDHPHLTLHVEDGHVEMTEKKQKENSEPAPTPTKKTKKIKTIEKEQTTEEMETEEPVKESSKKTEKMSKEDDDAEQENVEASVEEELGSTETGDQV